MQVQDWKNCWIKFLNRHSAGLDLSNVNLDGSHTPTKRGGENVEYQGRKKLKTTNFLYPADRQGPPLAMSEPVGSNRNDLYDVEIRFKIVTATLEEAQIPVGGLFPNADAGFKTINDSYKGFNYTTFITIALKKFEK